MRQSGCQEVKNQTGQVGNISLDKTPRVHIGWHVSPKRVDHGRANRSHKMSPNHEVPEEQVSLLMPKRTRFRTKHWAPTDLAVRSQNPQFTPRPERSECGGLPGEPVPRLWLWRRDETMLVTMNGSSSSRKMSGRSRNITSLIWIAQVKPSATHLGVAARPSTRRGD